MIHCDNLSLACLQYQWWAYIWDFTLLCVFKTNSALWVVNMILHLIYGEHKPLSISKDKCMLHSSAFLQEFSLI